MSHFTSHPPGADSFGENYYEDASRPQQSEHPNSAAPQNKDYSDSLPITSKLTNASTLTKIREFHGETSIFEAQAIVLPGENEILSSTSLDSVFLKEEEFSGQDQSAPVEPSGISRFMSAEILKETREEMLQLSKSGKESEIITRYEELSTLKAKEAKEDPLVGTILDNRYKITGLVGTGSNATVYKARNLSDNQIVAIKTIRSHGIEDIWRFNLEIESMRKMDQKNLVRYIDCIKQDKGRIFLVMELVQGISLHEVLQLHGPITDEETICFILSQVCDALAHAHKKKIIHRDLKTGNVVLSKKKAEPLQVKVLDFGLAKHNNENKARITMHGKTLGSPLYMSPEQCRGEEPTVQSDIYSLGILAYEIMTGIVPFIGESIPEIMTAHCDPNTKHIPLTKICPDLKCVEQLDQILSKSLAKDTSKRFRRVTRFKQALEFWISEVRSGAYVEQESFDNLVNEDMGIYRNINEKLRKSLEVTLQILPNKQARLEMEDITLMILSPGKANNRRKKIIVATIVVILLIVAFYLALNILKPPT